MVAQNADVAARRAAERAIASQAAATARLKAQLTAAKARLGLNARGQVTIEGWEGDKAGLCDACVVRTNRNTPEFRRALAAAESRAGRKVDVSWLTASGG